MRHNGSIIITSKIVATLKQPYWKPLSYISKVYNTGRQATTPTSLRLGRYLIILLLSLSAVTQARVCSRNERAKFRAKKYKQFILFPKVMVFQSLIFHEVEHIMFQIKTFQIVHMSAGGRMAKFFLEWRLRQGKCSVGHPATRYGRPEKSAQQQLDAGGTGSGEFCCHAQLVAFVQQRIHVS